MIEQLALNIGRDKRTRCGYCLRPLARQPEGDYACTRCRPLLARVRTPDEWRQFQVEAARGRPTEHGGALATWLASVVLLILAGSCAVWLAEVGGWWRFLGAVLAGGLCVLAGAVPQLFDRRR